MHAKNHQKVCHLRDFLRQETKLALGTGAAPIEHLDVEGKKL